MQLKKSFLYEKCVVNKQAYKVFLDLLYCNTRIIGVRTSGSILTVI